MLELILIQKFEYDQELTKIKFNLSSEESLSNVSMVCWPLPRNLENGAAFLSIIGDDPDGSAGVDSNKNEKYL